jgi:acyl carrier protein phosphodiesterase
MNFLAHLFLSGKDEKLMIGNYLADLLNKRTLETFDLHIQKGVKLHRSIDAFTDNHPDVLKACALLRNKHHKYAPILVDIFFDYFLTLNWSRYTDENFTDFRKRVYQVLLNNLDDFPEKISLQTKRMIGGDWLFSYGHIEGIDFVLHKLQNRVSKPEFILEGAQSLELHKKKLNEYFMSFFPSLIKHCLNFGIDINLRNEGKS